MSSLTIISDRFEARSGIPRFLAGPGATVEIRSPKIGDYAIGESTVIERKTVLDPFGSLGSGLFWRQIGELRACCGDPVLVVEGHFGEDASTPSRSVRGACLAVQDMGIPLISSESRDGTARWIHRLAGRRLHHAARRDRPIWSQRAHPQTESALAALACSPGISARLSGRLLSEFGSVAAVANASVEQLTAVPEIGARRAMDIQGTLVGRL